MHAVCIICDIIVCIHFSEYFLIFIYLSIYVYQKSNFLQEQFITIYWYTFFQMLHVYFYLLFYIYVSH